MRVAVLVVSRNRPDLVRRLAGWLERNMSYEHDLILVEAGTDREQLTEHTTLHYPDADFRGKAYAHDLALQFARQRGERRPYDYYWVLMNDVVFDEGVDAARILIEAMEAEPRLALLSPTCKDRRYPGSGRRDGGGWRAVTTCDYLGFMLRAETVARVGFLNPAFKYCWGAIHELAYKIYRSGGIVAYSDDVEYEHLGGTTYGAEGTKTISREEYQVRAKRFAYTYFLENYGPDWPERFWAAAQGHGQGHGIEVDTFGEHNRFWATAFRPNEILRLKAAAEARPAPLRLHLGCGTERREGWLNVDVNPQFAPDLVAPACDLSMLEDRSCEVIESCHLFEHLTLTQARAALREWRRLLIPGGELHLELPNLARCIELIGTDLGGYDLGLISLFGYPPEVDEQGEPQLHKWGWTPASLEAELLAAGFEEVQQVPITQTGRPAAKFARDMRLVGRVARELATSQPPVAGARAVAAAAPVQLEVLAWPRYDDAAELDRFFHVFARVLSGRADVRLNLRVDPQLDPPRELVVAALQASHGRVLGAETALDVRLVDQVLTPQEWRELGKSFVCRIRSTTDAPPRDAIRQAAVPIVSNAVGLYAVLQNGGECAASPTPDVHGAQESEVVDDTGSIPRDPREGVLVPPGGVLGGALDPALLARIHALHPWFYPVTIGGMTVIPGLGSVCDPHWLANRAARRISLLVEEVLTRVDFRGKSVLDLACNCAFWSSYYALAGAERMFGIEGRQKHVEQARLYWEANRFLPPDRYEFVRGNIAAAEDWAPIRARGPFDVTLCAGILYHIPNYAEVLAWAAEVTNDVLIVDTRVQDGIEQTITEPGDLTFNAIAETRDKIVPDRQRLLSTLRNLGFDPQVMPVGFGRELGVDDVDSYADGARITIVARKVRAPLPRPVGSAGGAFTTHGTPR